MSPADDMRARESVDRCLDRVFRIADAWLQSRLEHGARIRTVHTRVARLSRHRLLTVEEEATVRRHLREFRDGGGTLVAVRRGSPQWQELGRGVHAEIEASMSVGESRIRMLEATKGFVDQWGLARRIWGEREFLRGELIIALSAAGRVVGVALVGPGLGYWGVNSVGTARGTDMHVKGSGTTLLASAATLAASEGEILVGHPQQPGWSHAIGRRRLYDPRTTDHEGWSRAAVRQVADCFERSGLRLDRDLPLAQPFVQLRTPLKIKR